MKHQEGVTFTVVEIPDNNYARGSTSTYWDSLLDELLNLQSGKAVELILSDVQLKTNHSPTNKTPGGHWNAIAGRLTRRIITRKLWKKGVRLDHAWSADRTAVFVWIKMVVP